MAGKSYSHEQGILATIFTYANLESGYPNFTLGKTEGTETMLYIALHTADPTESGTQSTNEISYTGYSRVLRPRLNSIWAITGNTVSPRDPIIFGTMTGGTGGIVTHFSIGDSSGNIYYFGTVTPNLDVNTGVTPSLGTDTIICEA